MEIHMKTSKLNIYRFVSISFSPEEKKLSLRHEHNVGIVYEDLLNYAFSMSK